MPRKKVVNIDKSNMSTDERNEFKILGYKEDEISEIDEKLKAETWQFWAKAKSLHLSLYSTETMVTRGGKVVMDNKHGSAHFENSFFHTADRDIARHIFMSDAYREKRVMLMQDKAKMDLDDKYQKFKAAAFASPENIERLKKELSEIEA